MFHKNKSLSNMGKKNSRKSAQKKSKIFYDSIPDIFDSSISIIKRNISKLEQERKLLDLECIKDQVKHYISRIYSDFALDLNKRRESRVLSKILSKEKNLPSLKITPDFITKMNQFLIGIQDPESVDEIKDFVYENANSFVEQLSQSFFDIFNAKKKLQIVLMHEAYSYLSNVSKQITLLLVNILRNEEKNIKNYHKVLFYQKIMKHREDLLAYLVSSKVSSASETQILKNYRKFEILEGKLYENSENCLYDRDISIESANSIDKNLDESINFLSIDQVVNYIEGSSKPSKLKKNKSKTSTNASSSSPQSDKLDLEIQEFEKKLNVLPTSYKLKLVLPEYFIQELRNKIKDSKEKTKLNNKLGKFNQ
jgi:hypothetical protein